MIIGHVEQSLPRSQLSDSEVPVVGGAVRPVEVALAGAHMYVCVRVYMCVYIYIYIWFEPIVFRVIHISRLTEPSIICLYNI